MTPPLDRSWAWKSRVDSANQPGCGFPLQNLPFCAVETAGGQRHLAVGIGDLLLDLHECARDGLLHALPESTQEACKAPNLNALMQGDAEAVSALRSTLMMLLRNSGEKHSQKLGMESIGKHLRPMAGATFHKPVAVGNYTDFFASIEHATNVGRLFRPDQPLLPNYKFVPIGYHGRASSLVISGSDIVRPCGQTKAPTAESPTFGPSQQLDYELEVGAYIARGNRLGYPIPLAEAGQHLFGLSLVNDWSARDVQAWEYQPLGPFLGKSFASTVSPWVVSMEALAPFRVPMAPRPAGDPEPLPYLRSRNAHSEALDIQLEVHLSTTAMRERALPPARLCSGNLRGLYWSFAQMIAHHTSNGCNLLPGDLLASGTVSGAQEGSLGSLLERTRRGATPLTLPTGETRSFLEDGDEVILSGFCERKGLPRIGLGVCRGTIVSALVPHPTS